MKLFRVYGLTCVLILTAAVAHATTIVMPSDEQLIEKSPVIVTGTILTTAAAERDGAIWTEASVSVERVLKGSAPDAITVRELGGELGDRATKLYGSAEFRKGEHVMLFLEPAPRGGYRTMDLFVGKLTQGRQMNGGRLWMRDDIGADVVQLDANFEPIRAKNVQRDAAKFETFVAERVAGRAGRKNYGVENPVLARDTNGTTPGGAQENFTLIEPARVYRWGKFDSGQTASWYSSGSQSGYTGGGVNELSTAMSSWTSYTAAKILYSYAGNRTGSLGGLSAPNGVNEVLFNDPLNEISGTFSGSGVVGTGGFNGVSGASSWNAPFAADSTHPAGTMTAYNITEGNLTIQDGVTPQAGISSTRLAEIVSHEFGHTLGFGHSADNTALMYAYVTGLGPSLRADDQLAARWLYPNGGAAPPPPPTVTVPNAPSNLTASASGSNVSLSWSDNASNETSQSVYFATGSGAFSKVADLGANVTNTTLSGFSAGTYRFYVVASNSAGTSAASNTATVTVATQLTASFTFTPQTGTANATMFTFYDQSVGGVTSRTWNFGDGSTATGSVVTHVYSRAGSYTVTLTVSGGGATAQAFNTVVVANSLVASFAWSPSNPTTNDTVTFTDQSTGGVTSWYWTLGNGSVSQQQNPTVRYSAAGTYNVTLSISRGAETAYATKTITVAGSAPVVPPPAPTEYRSLISAAAQQNGLGGTVWRTELSLFNAGSQGASVTALFIPAAGGTMVTRSLYLAPRQSAIYANTLLDLFGLPSGAGAVAIEATSAGASAELRVTSRTFTDGSGGTYGQAVPDVRSDDLETTLYLTGIQSNAAFRTNIGFVNRGASDVGANVILYDGAGNAVSAANITIPARNFQQSSLTSFFPETAGRSYDAMSMRVTTSAADVVTAFASVIDNRSQDPVYLQAMPARGGSSMTIAAVGRANGANGTFWRSDVMFFNPSSSRQVLSLRYSNATRTLALNPRETYLIADLLTQFGYSSGTGPLAISWSGGVAPVVTSRTYTTDASGGTYGQSVDPIDALSNEMFVPGLRSDYGYRSNVGVLNGGSEAEDLIVSVLSPAGYEMASTHVVLQPGELMQQSVTSLFPGLSSSTGSFTLYVRGDANAKLFAYGSMIDNASGDPVFFAGR